MSAPPPPEPKPLESSGSTPDVTTLLRAWSAGDRAALDALVPIVYAELHSQAARALRGESVGHTLQPTALVHEVYLRLADQARITLQNRAQFLGVAARCMRQILVDHARSRRAAKRGGGTDGALVALTLHDADAVSMGPTAEVLAIDEALERLAELDPTQARLVELRYFAGLTIEESAIALGVSPATLKREWTVARAWLRRELIAG